MPAIIVADAGVRHITFAFFHPTWWTRRRQAQSHQNPDFIILQVVIPIFLICSAITIGWGSKAFLAKLDPRSSEDLFVVLLVTVAFIGVAITGWTTLPQVAAIDQAREQSEHLFSVAVDPFLVLDEKGVICQANPAAVELFGAIAFGSAQSAIATNLVGSSINNIFPALVGSPQDWSSRSEQTLIQRNQSTLSIEMAISARANWDIEEYVVILRDITKQKMAEEVLRNANDELETRVEGRTAELRNANEKLRSEITERKIAEEAMHQSEISFRLLFENNPHPMWVCLPETLSFIAVNNAAVRQYGYSIAEFTNMTLADICPPEDIPAYLEMLSKVSSELNVDGIWRHRKQDGTIVDVEITAHTLTFAGTQANVVLAHDVTERHRADTALRQTLAKEKELNQLKSNFINVASHEFRTPLTTILGTAELLEHYSYKYTEEKKLTFLKRIKSSVKQMNEVIDAVLVIAKNEAGKVDFNPVPIDLKQWCHHLLEEMQLIASNAHTINFISCAAEAGTTPISIIAYMDEKLLRHIFSNLLSNAIKYSPSGGVIQFKLAIENESAIFQVTDSGIGIPPEDLQRLFDSFHRAKNVGSIPGTGLGLTIVHNSVNIHGGTITVHSQVGKGTTFTVNLPLNYQSLA
jgi:PAS domain S-box-containing protein